MFLSCSLSVNGGYARHVTPRSSLQRNGERPGVGLSFPAAHERPPAIRYTS